MKKPANPILPQKSLINETYEVLFFIKKGSHAETYRVKDSTGKTLFLKLFDLAKLHRTQFDEEGNIKEIVFLKSVDHAHVVQYLDDGECWMEQKRYAYLVLEYISGETLAERLSRDHTLSAFEIRELISEVLSGLDYLHTLNHPMIHNDINHHNIMVDLAGVKKRPVIIDFGYARYFYSSTKVYYREGLNPFYLASECFNNIFSPQSDLFSVGALIYHLLFGLPPWFVEVNSYQQDQKEREEAILDFRKRPLLIPAIPELPNMNPEREALLSIAKKALLKDPDSRFSSAREMLEAIQSGRRVDASPAKSETMVTVSDANAGSASTGKGFEGIAGMDELKEILFHDVIRALKEKELYREYGLTIPNGMLLYGPPGCGKSFFAQKLSDEVGYNYVEVKPSMLASIYVHGAQEKIAALFEAARKNAPTVLNFEEFDALVPRRDSHSGKNQSGEINEFLVQLNNCGETGVFVIASTNQPDLIDPAVLRSGRIDKVFFVPPPDLVARREMMRLLLSNRPVDLGIDYQLLAEKTENFVSADIQNLVNESARLALRSMTKITQDLLLEVVSNFRPSVNAQELRKHEAIRKQFEGESRLGNNTPIGFRNNNNTES